MLEDLRYKAKCFVCHEELLLMQVCISHMVSAVTVIDMPAAVRV